MGHPRRLTTNQSTPLRARWEIKTQRTPARTPPPPTRLGRLLTSHPTPGQRTLIPKALDFRALLMKKKMKMTRRMGLRRAWRLAQERKTILTPRLPALMEKKTILPPKKLAPKLQLVVELSTLEK